MHAERQHRSRKQHCDIDADRVHPSGRDKVIWRQLELHFFCWTGTSALSVRWSLRHFSHRAVPLAHCCSAPSGSSGSPVMASQIKPLPWVAMKLMASGVIISVDGECAKYCWTVKANGTSFTVGTATHGFAYFTDQNGKDVECEMPSQRTKHGLWKY
jgi:hypothetical protein